MPIRIGIVGADTLLGKDLGDLLSESKALPWGDARVHLIAAAPSSAGAPAERRLATIADEPALLDPLEEETLAPLDLIFFASTAAEARAFAAASAARGAHVFDVGAPPGAAAPPGVLRVPHPAARALAAVLAAAAPLGAFTATAVVVEPASERGMAGLNELQAQSIQLLALSAIPTEVFGAQTAYNVKAELPPEVHPSLAEIQSGIAADLRALALPAAGGPRFPLPALRLLQAPLFHGYVIALALRFASAWDAQALSRALRAAPLRYLGDPAEQPDVLSVAGESEIQVGALQPDALEPQTVWLHLAFDNLRLRAVTALRLAAAAWEHRHARV